MTYTQGHLPVSRQGDNVFLTELLYTEGINL